MLLKTSHGFVTWITSTGSETKESAVKVSGSTGQVAGRGQQQLHFRFTGGRDSHFYELMTHGVWRPQGNNQYYDKAYLLLLKILIHSAQSPHICYAHRDRTWVCLDMHDPVGASWHGAEHVSRLLPGRGSRWAWRSREDCGNVQTEAVSDSIWAKGEHLESSEQAWAGDRGGEHYPALVLSYELSGCLA